MRLPLAAVFAGGTWIGTRFDVDCEVVERIGRGDCPVENEPGLPAAVSSAVDSGALCATTDQQAAAATATLHVVIVPVVIDDDGQPTTTRVRHSSAKSGTTW